MRVTIIDRAKLDSEWGISQFRPDRSLVTIEISDKCPSCGGPRGTPYWRRMCEEGDWYDAQCWTNPCGHVDMYADVLKEFRCEPVAA